MIDFAVALVVASSAIWALLVLNAARPWAVLLAAAAALAWGLRRVRPARPKFHPVWLVGLPAAFLLAVHALTPEIQPDAAGYHLGLVARWARTGGFGPLMGFYDAMPLGLETLFLPAYFLGGATGAKLVHLALFTASLALIYRIGRQCGLAEARAAAAAVFYACVPVVMVTASSAYVDAGLVFFVLAAFSALLDHRWAAAGAAAGFCYAVKMSGAIVPAALVLWLLARQRWRAALLAGACAAIAALPWVGRALWLTGNPAAPLGNALFPNDWFHAYSERELTAYLHSYGNLSGAAFWRELLCNGAELQGLIGPACVILPAGLLALRGKHTRALVAAALILALPWLANLGARFVMPALPFAALAAAAVLPRRLLAVAAAVHAVLSWPPVMDLYASPHAWRLKEIPWRAALRLEAPEDYLARNLWEYRFARRVAARVGPSDTLLDLHGLPSAYLPVYPLGAPNSIRYDNLAWALASATSGLPDQEFRLQCSWPAVFVSELRIVAARAGKAPFAITEVRPMRNGAPLMISRRWLLDARPNGGASPLAMDNNPLTRWSTLDPAAAGDWWAVRFDRPVPLDGVAADFINLEGRGAGLSVLAKTASGQSIQVCRDEPAVLLPPRRRSHSAAAMLRANHIGWIAGRSKGDGHAIIVRALLDAPALYGLSIAEQVDDLVLFRVE